MDTHSLFSLTGRTALVTGGSRGIGKMIATGFIAQGAKVYISSLIIIEIIVDEHLENQQKNRPYKINVSDAKVSFQLVFFHARKNWLRDLFPIGEKVLISGKLEYFDGKAQITHPDYVFKPGNDAAR